MLDQEGYNRHTLIRSGANILLIKWNTVHYTRWSTLNPFFVFCECVLYLLLLIDVNEILSLCHANGTILVISPTYTWSEHTFLVEEKLASTAFKCAILPFNTTASARAWKALQSHYRAPNISVRIPCGGCWALILLPAAKTTPELVRTFV